MPVARMLILGSVAVWVAGALFACLARDPGLVPVLAALGAVLVAMLGAALRHRSWPDSFFILALLVFVWLPLCYLAVVPDVFSYIDGQHQHRSVSAHSILIGSQSTALAAFGWAVGRLALGAGGFRSLVQARHVPARQSTVLLAWFALSLAVQILMTFNSGYGLAGTQARSNFSGYFYYLLPADALALLFAAMIGGLLIQRRFLAFALALIVCYWAMKVYQGWKGALIQTVVAAGLFAVARAGWTVKPRMLGLAILVLCAYFVVLKPVSNIIRIANVANVSWIEAAKGHEIITTFLADKSPAQTRLTEGTVNALVAQDAVWTADASAGWHKFLRDMVEGIIPGDFFKERNFARIFSEDVLGQPRGMGNTFAAGILGTAYAIDPVWGGFAIGLLLAVAVSGLAFLERRSPFVPLSAFLATAGSLLCVEAVTEGAIGRLEQVLIWAFVLGLGLLFTELFSRAAWRLGSR